MIPLYKVHMPEDIGDYVVPVLKSGFISEGPKAKEFEQRFQEHIGNPYTALVSSGTMALMIAARLADIGPGDEVISSPMTCLATQIGILTQGAKVVWCDIDPATGNIDADKIEALVTPKTKAIVFVDWGGTPAELDKINAVAQRHGLKTIEDAAQALDARFRGVIAGNYCDFTVFSFQAIKHITTVNGGALACKTKKDYDKAVLMRWFGFSRGHNEKSPVCWEGDVTDYGWKGHMDDVSAAIGLAQLPYVDGIVNTHRRNGRFLAEKLSSVPGIEICEIPSHIESSYWFYTIKLEDPARRERFAKRMIERGVACGISHTRNDAYSIFKESLARLPGVDFFGPRMINIPCGWWVTQEQLDYIVKVVSTSV